LPFSSFAAVRVPKAKISNVLRGGSPAAKKLKAIAAFSKMSGASGDEDVPSQEQAPSENAATEEAPPEPVPKESPVVSEDAPAVDTPAPVPAETVVTHKHKHSLTIQLSGGTSSKLPFGLSNVTAKEAPTMAAPAAPVENNIATTDDGSNQEGTGTSGNFARNVASLASRREEVEAATHNLDEKSKLAETERQQLSDLNTVWLCRLLKKVLTSSLVSACFTPFVSTLMPKLGHRRAVACSQ